MRALIGYAKDTYLTLTDLSIRFQNKKQKLHEAGFRFFNRSFVQKEERTHRLDLFQSQGS